MMKDNITLMSYVRKNNQTSVSDADGEIPTLGSMDNAGNLVNHISALSVYLPVGISLSALVTNGRFYLYIQFSSYKAEYQNLFSSNHQNILTKILNLRNLLFIFFTTFSY